MVSNLSQSFKQFAVDESENKHTSEISRLRSRSGSFDYSKLTNKQQANYDKVISNAEFGEILKDLFYKNFNTLQQKFNPTPLNQFVFNYGKDVFNASGEQMKAILFRGTTADSLINMMKYGNACGKDPTTLPKKVERSDAEEKEYRENQAILQVAEIIHIPEGTRDKSVAAHFAKDNIAIVFEIAMKDAINGSGTEKGIVVLPETPVTILAWTFGGDTITSGVYKPWTIPTVIPDTSNQLVRKGSGNITPQKGVIEKGSLKRKDSSGTPPPSPSTPPTPPSPPGTSSSSSIPEGKEEEDATK